MSFRGYTANEWASPELLALVEEADRVADALPNGSTERSLVRDAIRKIELADTYVEKRLREEAA